MCRRRLVAICKTLYLIAAKEAPLAAKRWLDRFEAALTTLDTLPTRIGLAPENVLVEPVIHQFLFGRKPHVFRVLFTIVGDEVRIFTIRRAQRQLLSGRELLRLLKNRGPE